MRLLIQPGDGMMPLVKAIARARNSIEIVIFRFDHKGIEKALYTAVTRGVSVRALIAHTNQAGEKALRKLEMRMLAAGVIVARTADDLARYHGKLMIVDHKELFLLAFNFTHADIEQSRSFGVITRDADLVREAVRLFEADAKRHLYESRIDRLVVSPINARQRLADFIADARKELRIYDPKVSDPAMIRILQERARAGVRISIIGRLSRKAAGLAVRKLPARLHTRTIVRDANMAFVGSQSLRALELDGRREVGVIFRDSKVVRKLAQTFDRDWAGAEESTEFVKEDTVPAVKVAKKVAKTIAKVLPPVAPVVNGIVKEVVGKAAAPELNTEEVEKVLKDAVKDAVREAVQNVMEEAVEHNGPVTR